MHDSLTDFAAARGMTLRQLAKHGGVSKSTIMRRAKGERRPQLSSTRNFARRLGIMYEDVIKMVAAEQKAQSEDPQCRAFRSPIAMCRAIIADPTLCRGDLQKLSQRLSSVIKYAELARDEVSKRQHAARPRIKPRSKPALSQQQPASAAI